METEQNNVLAPGFIVRRHVDGVLGTIERFGKQLGTGAIVNNTYYIVWADGKLGYPSEADFKPCSY